MPRPAPLPKLAREILVIRRSLAREAMLAVVQAFGQGDLTLQQFGALIVLQDGEAHTVGALSLKIGRSLSATSRLVEQLVQRELLRREADPDDRRVRRVTLSAGGRKFLLTMMRRRAEVESRLIATLSPDEQQTVLRGMELLAEAARRTLEPSHD